MHRGRRKNFIKLFKIENKKVIKSSYTISVCYSVFKHYFFLFQKQNIAHKHINTILALEVKILRLLDLDLEMVIQPFYRNKTGQHFSAIVKVMTCAISPIKF